MNEYYTLTARVVISLGFYLFIAFVIIYSALIFFSLMRFGRSRMVGLIASLIYTLLVGALYLQVNSLIATL